tara:strand:- start:3136 stop:5769 length:2634 start_codon:yes stop_codon:yes gene_type:complete
MPLLSQSEKEVKRMRQTMGVGVADSQPGTNDMNDGATQLAVIDGVVTDVKKVNGQLYHNRIFTSFEEEADTILNEESVIKVQHKLTGNPVIDPGFQSDTFSSGFTGNGYKLDKDTSVNEYNFEVDNMIVRGTMSVYELLIQQIRATNGGIFVTSSAKVESSSSLSASDDSGTITFDDPSGNTPAICPFADGDIIMMQRVNPNATVAKGATSGFVKKLVYEVISVSGNVATVDNTANTQFNNADYPKKGDEFVRIGNTGDTANRDGVIYITSDDTNSPFMEIFESINSYSEWTTAVPKVRLGKLAGITYDGSSLTGEGFGLYSENVFLTGKIIATSGKIGGVNLAADKIYVGTGTANNDNTGFYLDDSGVLSLKDKFYWNGSSLTLEGAVTATSGSFTGTVTAGAGTIANWTIGTHTLTSSSGNVILDQTNQRITLGAKRSLTDSNDGVYLHTTGLAIGADEVFKVTSAGELTATSGTFTGSITGATGTFGGTLTIGSGTSTIKASTDGLQVGHGTFGSAPFRVTPAGVVTATNIVLTAASGSTFNNGTISGFTAGSSGFSSSNFSCNTDGSVSLAANAFKVYANGDLYLHPSASDISAAAGGSAVRRGIIQYDTSDTSGDYWKQYHDFTDNIYKFLYNGNNRAFIDTDGMVRSNNGFREGLGSAATECEIHNNEVQIYANVSDNARYFQVRNTDTSPGHDHTMGGLRWYVTAHSDETNYSGWNCLIKAVTPPSGVDLQGQASLSFRAGHSGTARWWNFKHNGESTNAAGTTTWNSTSDERAKENITTVSNALTTLDGLRPVTFNYTDDFVAKTDLPSSKKWGFVAQEFKNVISEGVTIQPEHGYNDFHMLNTDMLVPLLVKAVKELKAEVEELKNSG